MTPISPITEGRALPAPIHDLIFDTTLGKACLRDYFGHQLVLYFYPKDDTPGCTIESQEFSARHSDFLSRNTQVVGVSRDSLASHLKFINKHRLSIALISDPSETLCNAFGVMKDKNMYGKTVRGIERSTFLIGADGMLLKSWRGVKVPGHVEEVLSRI